MWLCVCACVCILCTVIYQHCLENKIIYLSIYLSIYCSCVKHLEGFDLRGRRGENLRICSFNLNGLTTLCRMKMEVGTAVNVDLNEGTVSSLMLAPGLSLTGVEHYHRTTGCRHRAMHLRFQASSLPGSSLQKLAGIKNSINP